MTITSTVPTYLLALLTALLLWLGYPGGGEFWPVLSVAFVPLLYVAYNNGLRKSFVAGLVGGVGHFILLLYWIVSVLGQYGGLPWFISVPALVLLSLYMSLFVATFCLIASFLFQRNSWHLALWTIPAAWVGLDWLRSFLFSGFPWMDPGYGLWKVPTILQAADLFGHHGLSFMIVLLNTVIVSFFLNNKKKREKVWLTVPVAILFCATCLYGHYRWQGMVESVATGEKAVVGVVQGNIDQSRKWTPGQQQSTVDTYLSASTALMEESSPPELIVWPETALPFFPSRSSFMGQLRRFVFDNKVTLLTGSPWFEVKNPETRDIDFYNSAFLLHPTAEYGDKYFKSHLVPFGEYVPLQEFLPFIAPLVEAVGDFSTGTVATPLKSGRLRGGVLICFESIFPEISRNWVNAGANILINLTNDAWYGRSSAPSHSMAMTVFRAVETRRSLVRAANTGISGFIDPLGRVTLSSEIFTNWAKHKEVCLRDEVTFHTRYGYLFAPFCFLWSCIILVVCRKRGIQTS